MSEIATLTVDNEQNHNWVAIISKLNELIEAHNKLERGHKSLAYESDPLNRIG